MRLTIYNLLIVTVGCQLLADEHQMLVDHNLLSDQIRKTRDAIVDGSGSSGKR